MNYSVRVRLESLDQLEGLLQSIVAHALGPTAQDNVPLAQGGAQGAVEYMGLRAEGTGIPTDTPLNELTVRIKGHSHYQYDRGGLWKEQEIEAGVEGERAYAIVWPKEVPTGREWSGGQMTYRSLIKLWLDAQRDGYVVIVTPEKGEAFQKAIAWLAIHSGTHLDSEKRKASTPSIVLPGREVIPEEVKAKLNDIVGQVAASLVAKRIAESLGQEYA